MLSPAIISRNASQPLPSALKELPPAPLDASLSVSPPLVSMVHLYGSNTAMLLGAERLTEGLREREFQRKIMFKNS